MQRQQESNAEAGEFTVTDELYQISEATNDDGTVNVEIFDYEKSADGENVIVSFRTPTGDRRTEMYPWPKVDSAEYAFVRLCRQTVGGLNAAEFLKTDGAEVRADPDTWELCVDTRLRNQFPVRDMLTPPNATIESIFLFILLVQVVPFFYAVLSANVALGVSSILVAFVSFVISACYVDI